MSAFVLDYDHNAPNAEHLKNTHYGFYKAVRDKHPDLPILILTAPTIQDNDRFAVKNVKTMEHFEF